MPGQAQPTKTSRLTINANYFGCSSNFPWRKFIEGDISKELEVILRNSLIEQKQSFITDCWRERRKRHCIKGKL